MPIGRIAPEHIDPSAIRKAEPGDHLHQRRLACPVLAEQPADRPGSNFEMKILEKQGAPVGEVKLIERDHQGQSVGRLKVYW